MTPEDYNPILLQAQLGRLQDDFDRLIEVLESPRVTMYSEKLVGRFKMIVSRLLYEQQFVKVRIEKDGYGEAWKRLSALKRRSQHLKEEALELLGGVAIRKNELDHGVAETAQRLAEEYVAQAGVSWSPVLIVGQQPARDWPEEVVAEKAQDPGDSLVRLPVLRWDIWHLPLIVHDYGYWVAKWGQVKRFDEFVDEQTALVHSLLNDEPALEGEVAPLLAEIRRIWEDRSRAVDLQEVRQRYQPLLARLVSRQKVHLWRLIADAFATYFVGPAYAYALLFLTLDPSCPSDVEGERAPTAGDGRSRYLPADARRMAVVMQTLEKMNKPPTADAYTPGPYTGDLTLLASVWENALEVFHNLKEYRRVQETTKTWSEHIYEGLTFDFGWRAQDTADLWKKAESDLTPGLAEGLVEDPHAIPDVQLLINAAWRCRPRYPDRIDILSQNCERLLKLPKVPHARPLIMEREGTLLIKSRIYDLETDLLRTRDLFRRGDIDPGDRDAVAGRFFRLVSEQDFELKHTKKAITRDPLPLASALSLVIAQSHSDKVRSLKQEVLDFLGGVLMRTDDLDQGTCSAADALLRYYASLTGVNWASRSIPGRDPLFSGTTDMVHLSFPDWDIWNLPMMAHEFGHVTALATPAFLDLLAEQELTVAKGHPDGSERTGQEEKDYAKERRRHIHEFFADAFAVYCQGPSFAYDVVMLHFNPVQAYLPRGDHPTHAERVEVILKVLEGMNKQQRRDDHDPGPYFSVIKRVRAWWNQAVGAAGAEPDNVYRFHKIGAMSLAERIYELLDRYYRFGARYKAEDWKLACDIAEGLLEGQFDLSKQKESLSLRDVLNIAWACRVSDPVGFARIEKMIQAELLP